jgi:hypothetical protein
MLFASTFRRRFVLGLSVTSLLLALAGPAWSGQSGPNQQAPGVHLRGALRAPLLLPNPMQPNTLCDVAVQTAESRHRLPSGLLFAISQVESGRPDPALRRLEPWPWTVQAEGRGIYFESKAQAVQWVREAMARGVTSIDTGCMQVNLFYHPQAFATAEEAFDPGRNADYAARFLVQLHAETGDWQQAAGFYHSQTLALAASYRERVGRALNGEALGGPASGWPMPPRPPTILDRLGNAWRATISNDPEPANSPALGTHDWSFLLHAPNQLPQRSPPSLLAQRPRRYADQSFLLPSVGRSQ